MKVGLLLLALFVGVQVMAKEKIGYVVWKSGVVQAIPKQYTDIETVQRVFDYYFPDVKINIDEFISHHNYFQITTPEKSIYIEKKYFVKKRKNGVWKTKKIK